MVFVRNGGTEERHNPIPHDLVHGPLVAMHGVHHALQHGVEELAGFFGIAIG
jgi:hypothetical protein